MPLPCAGERIECRAHCVGDGLDQDRHVIDSSLFDPPRVVGGAASRLEMLEDRGRRGWGDRATKHDEAVVDERVDIG